MKNPTDINRRRLLKTTGGALAWAGMGGLAHADLATGKEAPAAPATAEPSNPLPDYASWKDADSMIVHSANTIETKRSAFGSGLITPLDRLFVRNNVTPHLSRLSKIPTHGCSTLKGSRTRPK